MKHIYAGLCLSVILSGSVFAMESRVKVNGEVKQKIGICKTAAEKLENKSVDLKNFISEKREYTYKIAPELDGLLDNLWRVSDARYSKESVAKFLGVLVDSRTALIKYLLKNPVIKEHALVNEVAEKAAELIADVMAFQTLSLTVKLDVFNEPHISDALKLQASSLLIDLNYSLEDKDGSVEWYRKHFTKLAESLDIIAKGIGRY